MTRRADRLFQIVQILRGWRLTTAAHLAERLGVSERTVYRDIGRVRQGGVNSVVAFRSGNVPVMR